jgi:poly-gamma-glutamate capsule biosynthesis protein CapA/YwtB (metallophosphatase superfamily)
MTERQVYPLLWALAVLCLGAVATGLVRGWNAAVRDAPTAEVDTSDGRLTVLWLGDTMLGDAAQDSLEAYGYDWPLERLETALEADFIIANAEAPITALTEPWDPSQHWHYNAQPEAAHALSRAGIGALGLANNHAMDRGPEGLRETRETAREAGMLTFGAGMNESEAELPLLVKSPVGTVAVVALGKYYGRTKMAGRDQAGTVALSLASIRRGYRLAKQAGADWVVGYVHWGAAYSEVNEDQRRYARMFAEAGYDLVVGHHPHVAQSLEVVGGMPVAYSLGNFVFGAPGRFGAFAHPGTGLMLASHFSAEGLQRITLRCIVTDNRDVGYQPRPCTEEETHAFLPQLHPQLVLRGDSAVLPVHAPASAAYGLSAEEATPR